MSFKHSLYNTVLNSVAVGSIFGFLFNLQSILADTFTCDY